MTPSILSECALGCEVSEVRNPVWRFGGFAVCPTGVHFLAACEGSLKEKVLSEFVFEIICNIGGVCCGGVFWSTRLLKRKSYGTIHSISKFVFYCFKNKH